MLPGPRGIQKESGGRAVNKWGPQPWCWTAAMFIGLAIAISDGPPKRRTKTKLGTRCA